MSRWWMAQLARSSTLGQSRLQEEMGQCVLWRQSGMSRRYGIVGPDMMPIVDLIYEVNTHKNISIKEINVLANKEKQITEKLSKRKHE